MMIVPNGYSSFGKTSFQNPQDFFKKALKGVFFLLLTSFRSFYHIRSNLLLVRVGHLLVCQKTCLNGSDPLLFPDLNN